MIVEFLGFPASGKTTIVDQWILDVQQKGVSVKRGTLTHLRSPFKQISKLLCSIGCVFCEPRIYLKSVRAFLQADASVKNKIADFLNVTYLATRYHTAKNSKSLVVFDQGLMQAYWSMTIFSKGVGIRMEDYESLAENIVVISLPQSEAIQRLRNRIDGPTRFKNLSEQDLAQIYKNFENLISDIEKTYETKHILKIDGLNVIQNNVSILNQRIHPF